MSASRERKKRQEYFANGGVDQKAVREAEQKAKNKKSNILYGTIAALFLVTTAFLVIFNTGILQRNATAVTIDGTNYSAAEYSYHYNSIYQTYYSYYGSYTSMILSEETLQEETLKQMKFVHAALKAAKDDGYTLNDAGKAQLAANIQSVKNSAQANGQSYGAYVKMIYGALVSTAVYESTFEDYLLAAMYADNHLNNLKYSIDEINAEYDANPESYDRVDFEYLTITAKPETKTDADGKAIEATDAETEAAWKDGQKLADELLKEWKKGTDMEAYAQPDDDNVVYASNPEAFFSTMPYLEWCFEDNRKAGDTAIVEDEDYGYIYVVKFNERYRIETPTVNVRHILVSEKNLDVGVSASEENLKAKAEEILAIWDGTEEGFAMLANQHSADAGSNTNGGLYESIVPGEMVEGFNDWCFDESRKVGDTGLVYNKNTSYTGYHIMYYCGASELTTWQAEVHTALANADYSVWEQELVSTIKTAELKNGAKHVA